jgi:hypothetical protein
MLSRGKCGNAGKDRSSSEGLDSKDGRGKGSLRKAGEAPALGGGGSCAPFAGGKGKVADTGVAEREPDVPGAAVAPLLREKVSGVCAISGVTGLVEVELRFRELSVICEARLLWLIDIAEV